MIKTLRGIACAIILAAAPGAASAALIIDTGAPVALGSGWSLFGTGASFQFLAAKFSLVSVTTITGIEGFIGSGAGGTFHIGLADGADAPRNTVDAGGFYTKRATAGVSEGAWYGISGVNWSLAAGDWWVYFAVLPNGHAMNTEGGDDTLTGYMPKPAPNPLLDEAFISQSTGGWLGSDSLDIGVRIYDNTIGGVPEPAAWALMICGFGMAGAMIRRRRVQAALNV